MTNMRQALQAAATGELLRQEPNSGLQKFCPGPEFIGFDGHFPDFPVLPAMLQVLLGVIVCEKLSGTRLKLLQLDKAKFMRQIQPGQTITVSCRITESAPETPPGPAETTPPPNLEARITITSQEEKAAAMSLLLKPA